DNNRADDTSDSSSRKAHAARKIGTLENGTTTFMRWLNSVDKQQQHNNNSLNVPIILRRFIKNRRTTLYDKNLESEVDVEINEGVPFCRYCNLDDCSHVGFTISLEQMCEDFSSNLELSVDDIVDK
ncbi:MAG: hypothetical protein ACRD5J_17775, partial [Nitrososphaeraceae archaeon]